MKGLKLTRWLLLKVYIKNGILYVLVKEKGLTLVVKRVGVERKC